MSSTHSSITIDMDQVCMSLSKKIIKRREPINIIKLKMVTNFANMTVIKWWLPLNTYSLF